MQILIALGRATNLEAIIRLGTLIQQMTNGTLTLLAVIEHEKQRSQAESRFKQAKKFAETAASQIQTHVRIGQFLEEIIDEAAAGNYDLLIIEDRPQNRLLRRLVRPKAEQLIANVPCPVLIARGQTRPLNRLLVCESGREPSLLNGLLTQMSPLINQIDDLTVLHVMSQIAAGPGIPGWELRADANELIQKHTPEGSLLEDDLARLEQLNVQPKAKVRHGLVVQEILAEAQSGDYDLIIIGAHPEGGWKHYLLDDLAREIISQVARPLLVMKR